MGGWGWGIFFPSCLNVTFGSHVQIHIYNQVTHNLCLYELGDKAVIHLAKVQYTKF